MRSFGNYLSLIKFSHTVFALPFAMIGVMLGIQQLRSVGPEVYIDPLFYAYTILPVLLCMVFARSAAMAFNRYLDRHYDAQNPRTAIREIPAGIISANSALWFTIINAALFVGTTWFINTLCFLLSPVALLVILGYSFTKRFTALCHLVLGLGLSLAPIGAYLAVTGMFDLLPILFSCIVFCWVSGFDIIYALQDAQFDRSQGLYSIPAIFGEVKALRISRFLHAMVIVFLAASYMQGNWGIWYIVGIVFFAAMLLLQQRLVKPNDLSKVNLAFFTTNGVASVVFAILVIIDLLTT